MCRTKEEFIKEVSEQIRCKKAVKFVSEELADHIDGEKEHNVLCGMSEKEAEYEAVKQMGDPVETGVALDRIHRPKIPVVLLISVAVISVLGILIQFSFANSTGMENGIFYRQIFYVLIGWAAMTAVLFVDYTFIGKYPAMLWLAVMVLYFVLEIFSTNVNGIKYFFGGAFDVGYFTAFLFVPIYGGILFSQRKKKFGGFCLSFAYFAVTSVLCAFFRLPAAFIVSLSCFIMLLYAAYENYFDMGRMKTFLMIAVFSAVALAGVLLVLFVFAPYRAEYFYSRIMYFVNSAQYAHENGYLREVLKSVLSEAKVFQSADVPSKFSGYVQNIYEIIPELQYSYVFTYIIAFFGIVPAIAVTAVFVVLSVVFVAISLKQKNKLGRMISFSVSILFILQTVLYILSNVAVLPEISKYMPFLSFGGSGIVVNMVLLGIVMSVFRNTNIVKEPSEGKTVKFKITFE